MSDDPEAIKEHADRYNSDLVYREWVNKAVSGETSLSWEEFKQEADIINDRIVLDASKQPNVMKCLRCGVEETLPAPKMNIRHFLAIIDDFEKRHKYCEWCEGYANNPDKK